MWTFAYKFLGRYVFISLKCISRSEIAISFADFFFFWLQDFLQWKKSVFSLFNFGTISLSCATSTLTDDCSLTNQSLCLYHRACPISICIYLMHLTPSLFSSLLTCSSRLPHDPIRSCPNLPLTPPPHSSSNQFQVLLGFLKISFPISISQLPWSPPYPGPSTLLSGPSEKHIFSIY